jgi:hypothetical protein
MNKAMNLSIPKKLGNFLSSSATISSKELISSIFSLGMMQYIVAYRPAAKQ